MIERLDDILDRLHQYGEVFLHSYNDGTWGCWVEAKQTTRGFELKVRSDHNHSTAFGAALQCLERVTSTTVLRLEAKA